MRKMLSDAEHLVRLAVLGAIVLLVFLAVRHAVVPAGFGEYAPSRASSLDEVRARPISFAGHEACEACHDDIAQKKKLARHAHLGCEACHGALAAHADDPSGHPAAKPDAATLCVRCHEADAAKPKGFPQVAAQEHAGDVSCTSGHDPHRPKE